jgi:hypothetical protein
MTLFLRSAKPAIEKVYPGEELRKGKGRNTETGVMEGDQHQKEWRHFILTAGRLVSFPVRSCFFTALSAAHHDRILISSSKVASCWKPPKQEVKGYLLTHCGLTQSHVLKHKHFR